MINSKHSHRCSQLGNQMNLVLFGQILELVPQDQSIYSRSAENLCDVNCAVEREVRVYQKSVAFEHFFFLVFLVARV